MFLICSLHPPSFMRTAIGRRPLGSASKPELDDGQSCSDRRRFEPEFDERRRLLGIIHIGINRIRVPRKGEQSRSVHGDDLRLPRDMLETGVGDVAACYLSRREWPVQPHSEPFTEFGWIGERTPDTLDGCTQFDIFSMRSTIMATSWLPINGTAGRSMQPKGCLYRCDSTLNRGISGSTCASAAIACIAAPRATVSELP